MQWQERPNIYRLAPDGWQKGHPRQSPMVQAIQQENAEPVQAPDAWTKLRKQSWARLLQKVYEVDPFICPKCHGTMSVVAIIEDPKELTRIIDWAKQQERGQPVPVCPRFPPELARASGYYPQTKLIRNRPHTRCLYGERGEIYAWVLLNRRKSGIDSTNRLKLQFAVSALPKNSDGIGCSVSRSSGQRPNFNAKLRKSRNDRSYQ